MQSTASNQAYIPRAKLNAIKEFDNNKEVNRNEELAEYYAIITATELLEAVYSRDAVTPTAYGEACARLISQFKTTDAALRTGGFISDTDSFFRDYQIDCPRAYDRLVRFGVPATVMTTSNDNRTDVKIVAETVQAFITAMDALRLDQRATDEIQPLIAELTHSLHKVKGLPGDFEGTTKMVAWLQNLNGRQASDELDEKDVRQLSFDLDSSYNAFHKFLSSAK